MLSQIFSNVFIIQTKSKIVRIRKLFLYSFFIDKEIDVTIEKYIISYYIEFIMEAKIKVIFQVGLQLTLGTSNLLCSQIKCLYSFKKVFIYEKLWTNITANSFVFWTQSGLNILFPEAEHPVWVNCWSLSFWIQGKQENGPIIATGP